MRKLDRLSKAGIVAIIVIALLGGAGVWWWSRQPLQPAEADPSTPSSAVAEPTPTPSCEPGTDPCTPELAAEQEELKRLRGEAEKAQRAVFAERTRLANAGGADEPTDQLSLYASGAYLDLAMASLREQKRNGTVGQGTSKTVIKSVPGETRPGADPRLTMEVCEDNSAATFTTGGATYQASSAKGPVFAAVLDGHVKLVGANMVEVESCG